MDIKDALTLMISFGVLIVVFITLVVNIIVAFSNKRK